MYELAFVDEPISILININEELSEVENLLCVKHNIRPPRGWYFPYKRYPTPAYIEREVLSSGRDISATPRLPILSAELFIAFIDFKQCMQNQYGDFYYTNPVYPNDDTLLLKTDKRAILPYEIRDARGFQSIIMDMFPVDVNTAKQIEDIYKHRIWYKISDFIQKNVNSLFSVNIENVNIVITNYGDIRVYRYGLAYDSYITTIGIEKALEAEEENQCYGTHLH